MARPSVLVFDLDDTLYLERDFALSGFHAVGQWAEAEIGLAGIAQAATRIFQCGTRTKIFDESLRTLNIEPEPQLIEQMVDVFRKHDPAITLLPDVERFLERQQTGARLALITDGYYVAQKKKVEALRLSSRGFDPVVITDTWGRDFWKPHQRAYQSVVSCHSGSAHDFVYIADNPTKDFLAPNAMGWITVQIAREGRVHRDEAPSPEHAADVVITSLDELERALDTLDSRSECAG